MSFFGGNPFATPVGQKIESATCETLPSEDWGQLLEVCDLINGSEEGPRDAVKAIRKRLTQQPKNYTSVMYTLTVLETCVKNCGKRFHVLACSKDFVQELVKLIGPKNEPPAAVQEKVLALIQCWADTFRHQPELAGVSQIYADLKHKGVEFPSAVEESAPIITPQRTVAPEPRPKPPPTGAVTSPRRHHQGSGGGGVPAAAQTVPSPVGPVTLTGEQKGKMHSELDVVESNARVLSEMLAELTPGKEHPEDIQLLQELHATCLAMQQRVVELVGRVSDDILTADLLRINDNLNNVFIRYDRYMNKVKVTGGSSPVRSPVTGQGPPPPAAILPPSASATASPARAPTSASPAEVSLIDLSEDPPSAQLANMSVGGKKNDDLDFDMLAQSRTETTSTRPAPIKPNNHQKDTDFDEMEAWLNNKREAGGNIHDGTRPEHVTSSEFDRFLAERAAAADSLPTITAVTGSTNPHTRQRTMQKDDNKDHMFAL